MREEPGVIIRDVSDIKALRLYHFDSVDLSDMRWIELYDTLFAQMNPEFGYDFILGHKQSGFSNIRVIASDSKEHAAIDVAHVLKTLVAPQLQAFVQVCEFTMSQNSSVKYTVWLVSFISGAKCVLQEHQAKVIFSSQPIGFLSSDGKSRKYSGL